MINALCYLIPIVAAIWATSQLPAAKKCIHTEDKDAYARLYQECAAIPGEDCGALLLAAGEAANHPECEE